MHNTRVVLELVVQADGDGCAQPERHDHADDADIERHLPVAHKEAQIDFEPDDEQEKHKAQVRGQIQHRHARIRKDILLEAWNSAKCSRTEQDAADNFGYDAGLAYLGQRPVESSTENDDDGRLGESASATMFPAVRMVFLLE